MSTLSADEYSRLSQDEQKTYDRTNMERIQKEQESLPYTWNQRLDHVELSIPVPSGTRPRQVQVVLKRTSISVQVHNQVVVEVCVRALNCRVPCTSLSNWMEAHGRSVGKSVLMQTMRTYLAYTWTKRTTMSGGHMWSRTIPKSIPQSWHQKTLNYLTWMTKHGESTTTNDQSHGRTHDGTCFR